MLRDDQWSECPPGLVGELVSQRRLGRRRQFATRAGGVVATFFVLAVGIFITSQMSNPADAGDQISCTRAIGMFAGYHDQSLDDDERRKVEMHLRDCPHCGRRYESEYSSEARWPVPANSDLAVAWAGPTP